MNLVTSFSVLLVVSFKRLRIDAFPFLSSISIHLGILLIHIGFVFRVYLFLQSGPAPLADVRSLTHYGEPYDGNTRYFRSTLFVAAVRSCYGESCLLHGVDWMPPKVIIQFTLHQDMISTGFMIK